MPVFYLGFLIIRRFVYGSYCICHRLFLLPTSCNQAFCLWLVFAIACFFCISCLPSPLLSPFFIVLRCFRFHVRRLHQQGQASRIFSGMEVDVRIRVTRQWMALRMSYVYYCVFSLLICRVILYSWEGDACSALPSMCLFVHEKEHLEPKHGHSRCRMRCKYSSFISPTLPVRKRTVPTYRYLMSSSVHADNPNLVCT